MIQIRNPPCHNGPQTFSASTPPTPLPTPVVQSPLTPVANLDRTYQRLYPGLDPGPAPGPGPSSPPTPVVQSSLRPAANLGRTHPYLYPQLDPEPSPSPPPEELVTAQLLGMTDQEFATEMANTELAMLEIESSYSSPTSSDGLLPVASALGITSTKGWEQIKQEDERAREELKQRNSSAATRKKPISHPSAPPCDPVNPSPYDENTPFLAPSPTPSAPPPPSPPLPPCAQALFSYNPDHHHK